MIDVRCPAELEQIRNFADSLGPKSRESLEERVNRYRDDNDKKVIIITDRAPHSFYFEINKKDADGKFKFWYNGGIIYHEHTKTWEIHT